MREIGCSDKADIDCMDQTWVNYSHTKTRCWHNKQWFLWHATSCWL